MTFPGRRRILPALVVGLAASACTGAGSHPGSGVPTTTRRPAALRLAPDQVDHVVDTTFRYGAFTITVGHAVFDRKLGQLSVGLRFHNTSDAWSQSAIAGTLDGADGSQAPFSGQPYDVPPGASIDVTGTAGSLSADPVPRGSIAWGAADRARPVVRLDGHGGTDLWLPRAIPLDGWAHIGRFGVHATGAIVDAAEVDQGIQAPAGRRILRVRCEAFTNKGTISPFNPKDNLLLKLPDGTTVDAVDGSPAGGQLSWVQQPVAWADFPIPERLVGRYTLLLASLPKVGIGTLRPALIERRGIAFSIGALRPGAAPAAAPPVPDLTPPATASRHRPVDRTLNVGTMNVPGYEVTPTRLRWDPATATVRVDTTVTALAGRGPGGTTRLAHASGLGAPPQFGFTEAVISQGRPLTGTVSGPAQVDPARPTPIVLTFSGATSFDANDAALYIGPHGAVASSLPLGPASSVPAYPTPVSTATITAPTADAGSWAVALRAARFGLLDPNTPPPPGRRDLEVTFDVRAARDATKNAFGLSFSARYQLLLAGGSGYDVEAIAGDDPVQQQPGQTLRYTATFEVPETFHGGPMAFVLRSRSEVGDLTTSWVETRFTAVVGDAAPTAVLGGSS